MIRIEELTKQTKINFIHDCLTSNGKKLLKKDLEKQTDETLNNICIKFLPQIEEYLNNAPVKFTKFYAEIVTQSGKLASMEGRFESKETFKFNVEAQGHKVVKIVPARGHHFCKYCGGIADGVEKDILCDKCHEVFGHYRYSEL